MRAGAAGDAGPWRQRAILGRGRWDADAVDGVCAIEQALRCAGKGYVLGVKGGHRFGSGGDEPVVAGTAAQIASQLDRSAGRACQRAKAPRASAFTTAPISNSPILRLTHMLMA